MKLVLLTAIIVTLALVCEGVPGNVEPCQLRTQHHAYDVFVNRHVISQEYAFDRNSLEAWSSYLKNHSLCKRPGTQTFIDAKERDVRKICSPDGWRLKGTPASEGTNCMSSSPMTVYYVKPGPDCTVSDAKSNTQHVVVSCRLTDLKSSPCRPIHYVASRNPQKSGIHCRPPKV